MPSTSWHSRITKRTRFWDVSHHPQETDYEDDYIFSRGTMRNPISPNLTISLIFWVGEHPKTWHLQLRFFQKARFATHFLLKCLMISCDILDVQRLPQKLCDVTLFIPWRCDIFPNSFTFFQEQLCDLEKMYHSSWWAFVRQEKMSSSFSIMWLLRVWLFQGTSSPVGSSWPLWWQIPIVPRRRGQLQCRWRLQVPTKAWLGDA